MKACLMDQAMQYLAILLSLSGKNKYSLHKRVLLIVIFIEKSVIQCDIVTEYISDQND